MFYVLLQSNVKYLDLLQYNAGFSMQCFAAICTMVTSNSVTKEENLSKCINRQKSAIFCLNGKNKTVFEDEGVTFSVCTKLYVLVTRETSYLRYWGGL